MKEDELILTPLSSELLEQAVMLCAKCVGENLYTKAMIEASIKRQDECFYLLLTREKRAIAYIYFTLMNLDEAEQLAKQPLSIFKEITQKDTLKIGNLQSIGILPEYRKQQLSIYLVDVFLQWIIKNSGAEIAFSVCWKPNGEIPLKRTLIEHGFEYLADAKGVWYDREQLICPICEGRCECDAAIYYKKLERS